MIRSALLALALTACAVQPATSTDEQANCTQDQLVPNTICQQKCTPLDSCTDLSIQSGKCCTNYGHPAQPTTVGQVTCGNDPTDNDRPTCISTNHYDLVLAKIDCVTVTKWYTLTDGSVEQVKTTECHYA